MMLVNSNWLMELTFATPWVVPKFIRPRPSTLSKCTNAISFLSRFFITTNPRVTMGLPPIPLNSTIDVHIVPILSDNFSYLLHDKTSNTAALVDPAVPQPLLNLASELGATVTTSLTTHHHWDHAGGNEELASLVPGVDIIGSAYETAPAVTKQLSTGDEHSIRASSLVIRALRTPCHTNGHLCFALDANDTKAVFTGDTLFVAGCGKFFEGNAADMHSSLNTILASLDDDTLVFCGHEYTVTNLKFALSVEPSNEDIQKKLEWAKSQVENGLPTVPTSIADEKRTNPFMRNAVDSVKKSIGMPGADDIAVMKELRERKNSFRP